MMRACALLLAVLFLAGCNTMEGLGKDIQKGGEKLEKAATK
jgi:predicted small secreted protein